eukprot:TRINITY_DN4736_c0_g2_i3.p2 TRINITY_DN4736_c0_g2~~TRINITY_DN4736_c0_g2_i3.p2  ORF type:complete len:104 (+),score=27.20 TRINITY_DN4736_c0_g2_i3:50-361(+)
MSKVAIIVLVIAFVAAVHAACSATEASTCVNSFTSCSSGNASAICTCYPTYLGCLNGAGCLDDASGAAAKLNCQQICTADQCNSASSLAVGFVAVAALFMAAF